MSIRLSSSIRWACLLVLTLAGLDATAGVYEEPANESKPNIVLILADDLGWGDVSCNQPGNVYKTPQIDRIAREGLRMTNAHAPHSVCTPTRYALLTGRYCWRTFVREGVLPGYGKPLIDKRRMTLASLAKQHGYTTGAFGKWHIGLEWTPVERATGYVLEESHKPAFRGAMPMQMAAISSRPPTPPSFSAMARPAGTFTAPTWIRAV